MAIVLKNKNYAASQLAIQLLIGGGSLTVSAGEGALFPDGAVQFRLVLWSQAYGSPLQDTTREIVNATNRAGDVITITRAQEGTAAKQWEINDRVALIITAGKIDELETEITTRDMTGQVIAATTDAAGKVELATDAEATAGSDTERAITPANINAVLDARTRNRNVIINGAMEIAQRGTSFASVASASYCLDRWKYYKSGDAVITITQDSDVPTTAQAGCTFAKSLKIDCTTADPTMGAGDYSYIQQAVEGYNFRPLVGQTATLSFWVKAVKTGTYCVCLYSAAGDQNYIVEYTINQASTWEKKSITLTFDYSGGTWNYTNGIGVAVAFILMMGSTYHGTAETWTESGKYSTSNQVNGLDSTDNNFWLTGVQLEAGEVATPFEFRSFGEELLLCERYFQKSYELTTAPGTATNNGMAYVQAPTTTVTFWVQLRPRMRDDPGTVTAYSPGTGTSAKFRDLTGGVDVDAVVDASFDETGGLIYGVAAAADRQHSLHYTVSAEL